jgi:hypothetical protein
MALISYPKPPFPEQPQNQQPGHTQPMDPQPDHGEKSYKGAGKLAGKIALITGADSGIGRAVAIAFAREGADIAISYLDEDEDAKETARWVEEAGRKSLLLPGDITDYAHCRALVAKTVETFGRVDVLVNNAAYQMTYDTWRRSATKNGTRRSRRTSARCSGSPRLPCRICSPVVRS